MYAHPLPASVAVAVFSPAARPIFRGAFSMAGDRTAVESPMANPHRTTFPFGGGDQIDRSTNRSWSGRSPGYARTSARMDGTSWGISRAR